MKINYEKFRSFKIQEIKKKRINNKHIIQFIAKKNSRAQWKKKKIYQSIITKFKIKWYTSNNSYFSGFVKFMLLTS